MTCPHYLDLRVKFIKKKYYVRSSMHKFPKLLTTTRKRIFIHSFIHSLYVYFGNTVHIKIVQIMHRSCKLILKDDKKIKIQYYTQYNSIVKATKYHATKPIYQIEVETETNRYHE